MTYVPVEATRCSCCGKSPTTTPAGSAGGGHDDTTLAVNKAEAGIVAWGKDETHPAAQAGKVAEVWGQTLSATWATASTGIGRNVQPLRLGRRRLVVAIVSRRRQALRSQIN